MSSHQSSASQSPLHEEELTCVGCGAEEVVTGYDPASDGPYQCRRCSGDFYDDYYVPDEPLNEWAWVPMYADLDGSEV